MLEQIEALAGADGSLELDRTSLEKLDRVFHLVESKDRIVHHRRYQNCFVGSEVVDLLVSMGYSKCRSDAVKLGQIVGKHYGLFDPVSGRHYFEDGSKLYRLKVLQQDLSNTMPTTEVDPHDKRYHFSSNTQATSMTLSDSSLKSKETIKTAETNNSEFVLNRHELAMIVQAFFTVELKDRQHYLKHYKKCFLGSEAVDLLIAYNCATNRKQAVRIGRQIAGTYHLFEHVSGKREFDDGYFFYRFKKPFSSQEIRSQSGNETSSYVARAG